MLRATNKFMFGNAKQLKFVNATESNFRMRFIGHHIKSKHDVLSDVYGQKCLSFAQVCFGDGTTYHLIATQWDMHDVRFKLSYEIFDVLIFKWRNSYWYY